ncbi:hypothetical protein FRB95_011310 [Tulasnella sp. JGI-2019a]|nr:hypothetical protein FRB93_004633 [Tulasnella sp. JGI-2019a]KAG9035445.1 hypothetical protein FRB95_011310 [Tulasnella sp. JGI-2019a]
MAGAPQSPSHPVSPTLYPRWYGVSESPGKRFIKTLVLAFVTSLLVAGTFIFGYPGYIRWSSPPSPAHQPSTTPPHGADGEILTCDLGWKTAAATVNAPYATKTSLTLPIEEATTLFFHSSGANTEGNVHIVAADPSSGARKDVAVVDIEVKYWDPRAWESTSVCTLKRQEHQFGVGIYTHDWRPWGWQPLVFDLKVTLPASEAAPLILQSIETKLYSFTHELGDLSHVSFDTLDLHTSNSHVHVKSISTRVFEAASSNAPITGSFNVTDMLYLHTSNAQIDVDIQAMNNDWEDPTTITLKTSNDIIRATASLITRERVVHSKAPGYRILTSTSNKDIDVKLPVAPPDSHISYTGSTSNAPAKLALPPAFEGRINSGTSNAQASFHYDGSASKDPTGQGRTRQFANERIDGPYFEVETWWGDDRERAELGEASIDTSNEPVSISLL